MPFEKFLLFQKFDDQFFINNWHVTSLHPFHTTDLFWYPLKTSENQKFSDVFKGVAKEISVMKWVNIISYRDLVSAQYENVLLIRWQTN